MGDTIRSWRLRELRSAKELFSPRDVLQVHDTVNPARREIVRLGLYLRDHQPAALSDPSLKALAALENWLAAGASSDLKSDGAGLATRLSTFFRFVVTLLARRYGGVSTANRLNLTHNGFRWMTWIRRKRSAPLATATGPMVVTAAARWSCGGRRNCTLHL